MKALIDADNVAIAAAWTAEDNTAEIACLRAGEMIENLLAQTQADEYELWLSGPNNFRYGVYPEYKAQRIDQARPKHEKVVKDYLVAEWQANRTDGIEADDMLGIRQGEIDDEWIGKFDARHNIHSIIIHLDKDMNQIPGWHYTWELKRKGVIVREAKRYFVSRTEGDRFFFYQLLVGDPTDNIKGVPGIGPKKADAILSADGVRGWYEAVRDTYGSEEELDMNAKCVYIWRKQDDNWRNILE